MAHKVLVICLDGATLDLLRPWIDEGRLPVLGSFVAEGVSGELRSVVPPITAPAWASFMTGKNPGKHGVYYFVNRGGAGRSASLCRCLVEIGEDLVGTAERVGKAGDGVERSHHLPAAAGQWRAH